MIHLKQILGPVRPLANLAFLVVRTAVDRTLSWLRDDQGPGAASLRRALALIGRFDSLPKADNAKR